MDEMPAGMLGHDLGPWDQIYIHFRHALLI